MSTKEDTPIASTSEPMESSTAQATENDVGAKSDDLANNDGEDSNKSSNMDDPSSTTKQSKADASDDTATAPASESKDVDMPTREKTDEVQDDASPSEQISTPAAKDKKRRSSGVPEHNKRKSLSKKQSKTKLYNTDAQPGDYYFAKSKGAQPWPAIIAGYDMVPEGLARLKSAQREDGSWHENYADGGKSVNDRSFLVLYLGTNEFGWVKNTEMAQLDTDTVKDKIVPSMKGRLREAHEVASEKHDLQFFKDLLSSVAEARQQEENERIAKEQKAADKETKKAKSAEKKLATPAKKKSADNGPADGDDDDEDVEMADADLDVEEPKSKSKKRKADGDDVSATPKQSAKKPKIKINNTAKVEATPKSATKKEPKSAAKKTKKASTSNGDAAPNVSEMTEDEKRQKKEKEILFFRHKLQKGLLTKDQVPKESEMSQMSELITRLEAYEDLEVSIIRSTKINKVMKAILKLDEIPKETEFGFKKRAQALLDKWNKILDGANAATPQTGEASGTGDEKKDGDVTMTEAETKPAESASDAKVDEIDAATNMNGPATKPEEEKAEESAPSGNLTTTVQEDGEEEEKPELKGATPSEENQ